MKKIKLLIQLQLANLAKRLVEKYKPIIIGITGSVGKTSTRDAIYYALRSKYVTRKPEKNFNNEFGLPLAILGVESPGRNVFGWIKVFLSGYLSLWLGGSFPEVLVLEMGVDKPGDMDYLVDIARPDISVVTFIGASHYEFFKSQQAVAQEKSKIIQALHDDGFAILNADCDLVLEQKGQTTGTVQTYSTEKNSANVYVELVSQNLEIPVSSTFKVHAYGKEFPLKINAVGQGHDSAIAASVVVGFILKLDQQEIVTGLADYKPVPGRLTFIKGVRKTLLIDDSYNASPDSVEAALMVLSKVNRDMKVAILGDMLELGTISQESHQNVGLIVSKLSLDKLITVGVMGRVIAQTAIESGFSKEEIVSFDDSAAAAKFLQENVIPESAILVKGSRGMHMELISKELLLEPTSAHLVLPS